MTFTIHASRDGHIVQTMRIDVTTAIERAQLLRRSGWQVHITDSRGERFQPQQFDRLVAEEKISP
jgi:hypothetical protein